MEKIKLSIIWTDKALSDLNYIYLFIVPKSEVAAYKTILKIYDKVNSLEKGFGKRGQRELLLAHYKEEYRYLLSGNYKIIYSLSEGVVYINTIFDVRQNPEKLKNKK